MNWYEDNRSAFRNVFKGLTLISLAAALILCLIYALVPVSVGSSEITTIYDFVPLLCIPLSFFLAFRQFKTKREGDCFILDWIEMIIIRDACSFSRHHNSLSPFRSFRFQQRRSCHV